MSLITKQEFNKLIKTDTIDTSIFLLDTLKNIYNIVENNNQLTAKQKGITNPFPSEMYGVDLVSGNNLRRGQVPESINYEVGGYNGIYDYKNLRNNYVIKYINLARLFK